MYFDASKFFYQAHIVSVASSKTGIVGALQHRVLSFACRTMAADARSLGLAQCCLSAAKGGENKELGERNSKGKAQKEPYLSRHENQGLKCCRASLN